MEPRRVAPSNHRDGWVEDLIGNTSCPSSFNRLANVPQLQVKQGGFANRASHRQTTQAASGINRPANVALMGKLIGHVS